MASLRRFPRSRYWFAIFTGPNGRQCCRSTKETDKPRARKIAAQFAEAVRLSKAGALSSAQARRVIGEIYRIANRQTLPDETIRGYFGSWIARKKRETTPATFKRYSGIMTSFLEWLGPRAELGLAHLSAADIGRYRDELARDHSPASVNVARACIRAALYDAFRAGIVDVNEASRVPKLDEHERGRTKRRAFSLDELRAILAVCDQEWRGMVLVGAYAGLRLGDVASLRWQNVDLAGRELRFTSQKTGREMVVPIAGPLHAYLLEIAGNDEPDGLLFPKAAAVRAATACGLSNRFRDIMVKAAVIRPRDRQKKAAGTAKAIELSFHCLRHTATTLLKNAGVSDVIAREIIGHDSAAVSRTYSHIDSATLRAAIDRLPNVT